MKIVIAPDKFKGSLTAIEAAQAIALGIGRALPDAALDLCPVADGGEGTVQALVAATGGAFHTRRVCGPLPEMRVEATFGLLGDGKSAVIEMASASGLALLKEADRDPFNATTFGTGELLVEAAKLGAADILLGIGGSATVDAGIGCAQAAGLTVLLDAGEPVSMSEPLCGRDLQSVVLVKRGRGGPVDRVRITVACDVTNPLYGPTGAAPIFGPQKGASPQQVTWLDDQLRALAARLGKTSEAETPGAGAAGGLGFGMLAFFGATLRSGVDIVLDAVHLEDRLRGADLCITGEGRLDASSLHGKAPIGVARVCKRLGVACLALVGSIGDGADASAAEGMTSYRVIGEGLPADESTRRAAELLANAAARYSEAWPGGQRTPT